MTQRRLKQRAIVGALGKAITRRSRGRCELCEGRDRQQLFELPPFPEEPELERTLLTCGRCRSWLEGAKVIPVESHFLSSAIWSEEPAVRLAAARLLLAIDDPDDPWLTDALEAANVDPVTREFRDQPGIYDARQPD